MTQRIAIFLPSLGGGGAERVMLALAQSFVSRGISCDLVIAISEGQLLGAVPEGVRLVELGKKKTSRAAVALARYIRRERPTTLLATVFTANITALLASMISFTKTRVVTCEASPTDWDIIGATPIQTFLNRLSAFLLYRRAASVIAVSNGVRATLLRLKLVRSQKIHVIPNPSPELGQLARVPATRSRSTILACGRLAPQKDYPTLLRAFARLRKRIRARLVILGEGSLRSDLEALAENLGIMDDVVFYGFVPNPYQHMRTAAVFVHTARYEGFGVVLLEALACGCPVVATDSPGGVRDVLANGTYGVLLPVGDDEKLALAIEAVLTGEIALPDPTEYLKRFQIDTVAEAYLAVLLPEFRRNDPKVSPRAL